MYLLTWVATIFLSQYMAWGAHMDKFRTCDQTSFCRRQRNTVNEELQSSVVSNTITVNKDGFFGAFNNNKIVMRVSRVIGNVIRIEAKEINRDRYEIREVLESNARSSIGFDNFNENKESNNAVFTWNDDKSNDIANQYTMTINYSPFSITIENNGKTQVLVNDNKMFYFETYNEKDNNNDNEDNDENGLFSERFGSHTYHYDKGPSGIGLDFTFANSKHVYGIPEHATSFALKNTLNDGTGAGYNEPFRLWNLDVFEYELDLPAALYGAIPFIISHSSDNSNGVFWFNSAETYIDIFDSGNGKNIRWMSESGILETFIILGNYDSNGSNNGHKDVLSQYGRLTGNAYLPPLFSLGHHQCRWNYNDINDVNTVNNEFNTRNTPNDVIWLDIEHTDGKKYFTWDKYNFSPDKVQAEMLDSVYNNGRRRMVTIVDPHIKKDNNYYIYKEINDQDLFVKTRDNNVYEGFCWPGPSMYPDFTNPQMCEYWEKQFSYDKYQQSNNRLFIWNDMNEPSVFNGPEITMPKSNLHHNGYTHGEIHNIYGYLFQRSSFNGILKRSNNKERSFLLSRSFFAGSQRYGSVWTGDNAAEWDHLAISVPMLLSMSIAGLPFVGADIGGFFNNPDGELMARWYELGCYYPFFRNHAHQDTNRREFYIFDDFFSQRMRHAIINRYRILPYIYTLFYYSSMDLSPVMRPLWYEFSNDETTYGRDDAFMLGNVFYIQPVSQPGVSNVEINLPRYSKEEDTLWYDVRGTVGVYKGGNKYELSGFNSGIPCLRVGGSITVEKHRLRRSSDLMLYDPYTLIIALDVNGNAKGQLYFDDTVTTDHETKNAYYLIEFTFNNGMLKSSVLHSSNDVSNDISNILIERIIIVSDNSNDEFALNHVESIKIETKSNGIISKEFGIGINSLVVRKPNVQINEPFTIQLNRS